MSALHAKPAETESYLLEGQVCGQPPEGYVQGSEVAERRLEGERCLGVQARGKSNGLGSPHHLTVVAYPSTRRWELRFQVHPHRHADSVIADIDGEGLWGEFTSALIGIDDVDLIQRHRAESADKMSLSYAINSLIHERLTALGWLAEAPIFQDNQYQGDRWRLDFAKGVFSVEIAFNHGEAAAWNLLKPVLASELNHVQKAIQTKVGIVVTATDAMKEAGAFDSAVGSFEKYLTYLKPLQGVLSAPILLVGLLPPTSFRVQKVKGDDRKNRGMIVEGGGR